MHTLARFVCFLCLCISMLMASSAALSKDMVPPATMPTARLPLSVVPKRYVLYLEPDLTKSTFSGRETILIDVRCTISAIVLHAAELAISKATVSSRQESSVKPLEGKVIFNSNLEQVSIILPHPLKPGPYQLQLSFQGKIGDKLRGLYMAYYSDSTGVRQRLAVTQMEPTDARRLFPCFDEPTFKATYRLTVAIDPALTAISNSPTAGQELNPQSGKKIVAFAETPKMSTYLVALIVGHLEATPAKVAAGGVPIRVWTTPGKVNMGRYAQEIASRLLGYYNNYFGVLYPAPKLDLIAVPDFEAGAMENLGAITFRETALLVDEKTASVQTTQEVAKTVAHEMAHLWFGDLVTMKWWDDLWLNEAFATWMSTKAVDKLMPRWHVWDDLHLSRMRAMTTDSLQSSRPIHFPVHNALQANEMFDEITYTKGASILRMLETFMGEAIFQSGIVNFIKQHAFANASTHDLWAALGAASDLPVVQMMGSWVNQPGYPLLSLSLADSGRKITLHQQRFLLNASQTNNTLVWYVPVGLRTLATTGQLSPLPKTKAVHRLNALPKIHQSFFLPEATSVFIANADANGYYRVHYPASLFKLLVPLVQATLSPAERLQLLSDEWALTVAGKAPLKEYLELIESYTNEPDSFVVRAMIGQLHSLYELTDSSSRAGFEHFVHSQLGPTQQKLGWRRQAAESDLTKQLRGQVLETLGTIGQDRQVIDTARRLFQQQLDNADTVDPDLMDAITSIVAFNGDSHDYEHIKQCWKNAKTPETEERNLLALGSFQIPELISQTLALSLSDEVRLQDSPGLLHALLGNKTGKAMAWNFIKDNWGVIIAKYSLNMVPHVVSALSSLDSPDQETDLQTFFHAHPVPAGKHAVARMLERVHIKVRFTSQNRPHLSEWLKTKLPTSVKLTQELLWWCPEL